MIPWSPLARGFLAGNRRGADRGETTRAKTDDFAHKLYYSDADFTIADRVGELAARAGVKPTQIALAWLLAKPGVTAPIIGASKPPHLDEAVAARRPQARRLTRSRSSKRRTSRTRPSVTADLVLAPVVRRAPAPQLPADLDRPAACRSPAR